MKLGEDVTMQRFWWLALGLGCSSLFTGCAPQSPSVSNPSPSTLPSPQILSNSLNDALAQPRVLRSSTPSGLLAATKVLERLPEIQAGRPDPFASVSTAPTVRRQVVASAPVPLDAPPLPEPTIASAPLFDPPTIAPVVPLPLPPVQPIPLPPPTRADLPVLSVPSASPVPVARTIEVTGVVQIGDRVSAIVKVPEESTSRYVNEGDYLANGRIQLKRIDMRNGGEPRVIFVQNGQEIVRMVEGASTL